MSFLDLYDLPVGSVLGTAGRASILPPWPWYWGRFKRELVKRELYAQIEANQRIEGYTVTDLTHVSAIIGRGKFFEMTYPEGRTGLVTELRGRKVWACQPLLDFDRQRFAAGCRSLVGSPYDTLELLSFLIKSKLRIDLIGRGILDKYLRYVCSTALGVKFADAGLPFPADRRPTAISPGYYVNTPGHFSVSIIDC